MKWVVFKKWKTKIDSFGSVIVDMKDVVTDGFKNNDEKANGNGNMMAHVDRDDWEAKKSQFGPPDYILKE